MAHIPIPPALVVELQHVEQIIIERTHTRAAVISVAGARVMQGASGRARATFVLLAAQTGNYRRERVVHAAAAAELIYAATRTHDDLVDEAARRQGLDRQGEWSHGVALMVGDYLFALAAGEMALSPDPRVINFYSQAVMRISESMLSPAAALEPLEAARVHHLKRMAGAYGELFGAACRAGAVCAGSPPEQVEALGRFGDDLGLALRLADEVADFSGAEPPALTLRAGVNSLPLIFAAAAGDGPRLATALDSSDPDEQIWAISEVRRYGLEPTRAEIARLVAQARVALAGVPPGDAREDLARAADHAVARSA